MKALIVFDLDGTLLASRSVNDEEMAILLSALVVEAKLAIIYSGALPQFEKQVLAHLLQDENL